MLGLVHQFNHVRDDELGHDFENHAGLEILAGAALGHEAESILQQVSVSFIGVDRLDFGLVLLGIVVEDLLFDLIRLFFSEEHGQPVGEACTVHRSANFVLCECL